MSISSDDMDTHDMDNHWRHNCGVKSRLMSTVPVHNFIALRPLSPVPILLSCGKFVVQSANMPGLPANKSIVCNAKEMKNFHCGACALVGWKRCFEMCGTYGIETY
ncbi:MAG: hypothetical protein HFE62_00145 [Firmicutes bacterium]|nr:hypothetical protein [Bacillota bacterium]